MSSKPLSPIRQAWYRWKSLRLPWRKRFLIGLDLTGNTYWEFSDKLSRDPMRMRRIVQSANPLHYSDVSSQITPAWHQWLRHTRQDPPSLTEQSQDVVRQEQLKVLAARADERWAAKSSVLDMLGRERGQAVPALEGKGMGDGNGQGFAEEGKKQIADKEDTGVEGNGGKDMGVRMQKPDGKRHAFAKGERLRETNDKKEDPWKRAGGGASEKWQPRAWDPNSFSPKR